MIGNPKFDEWSKHIEIRYHFVRQLLNGKRINVWNFPTEYQVAADVFTKGLPSLKLTLMKLLGILTSSKVPSCVLSQV